MLTSHLHAAMGTQVGKQACPRCDSQQIPLLLRRAVFHTSCAPKTHVRCVRRTSASASGSGASSMFQAHASALSGPSALARPPSIPRRHKSARTSLTILAAQTSVSADSAVATASDLLSWLTAERSLPAQGASPQGFEEDRGTVMGFAATRNFSAGQIIMEVGGDCSVTAVDVADHPAVGALAEGRGELTGLALWLMAERAQGARSSWSPFLQALPERTLSPILWSDEELDQLRGSPVVGEARDRRSALQSEWATLNEKIAADPSQYPPEVFNEGAFLGAMSVVLAAAVYLPAAQCFALVPLLSNLRRSGRETAATIDYDGERESVTVTAGVELRSGEEVQLYDGRPNGEMVLATGTLDAENPADHLTMQASLVASDRLFGMKSQILEGFGLTSPQAFPITTEGMPLQMVAYLRLARLQDPGEFAKVTFERDVQISPNNEYEVLQLLLADCRELMDAYSSNIEEDVKILQSKNLDPKSRLATRMRLQEKRVVQGTMDAVRRRLAPIRGIPTKKGQMTDPNSDLRDIFASIEAIPNAPKKLMEGIKSWARGEQDPTWKKK